MADMVVSCHVPPEVHDAMVTMGQQAGHIHRQTGRTNMSAVLRRLIVEGLEAWQQEHNGNGKEAGGCQQQVTSSATIVSSVPGGGPTEH